MCGRFALKTSAQKLAEVFDFVPAIPLPPRYNIAPGQPVLAVRQEPTGRKAVHLRWGLVPQWAQDPALGNRLINARAETLASKPAYRDAYRYRRCLIPADGFYEWQPQGRRKQPYYIHGVDGQPLAFAGLWEHWQDAHGNELETCTIITTNANEVVKPIHDRMPVILPPHQWATWLTPDTPAQALAGLLRPLTKEILKAYPVGPQVNRPGMDDVSCLAPPSPAPKDEGGLFDRV